MEIAAFTSRLPHRQMEPPTRAKARGSLLCGILKRPHSTLACRQAGPASKAGALALEVQGFRWTNIVVLNFRPRKYKKPRARRVRGVFIVMCV